MPAENGSAKSPLPCSLRGSAEVVRHQNVARILAIPEEPLQKARGSGKELMKDPDIISAKKAAECGDRIGRKQFQFLRLCRPPSRHKTPPKATGLDLPETPHTPPKTQKELEEFKDYSLTANLRGIHLLNKESHKEEGSDDDSLISSSSILPHQYYLVEEIQDCDFENPADYASPEIIVSHHGKQITTPRTIPLVSIDAFKSDAGPRPVAAAKSAKPENTADYARPPLKAWERPVTGTFVRKVYSGCWK